MKSRVGLAGQGPLDQIVCKNICKENENLSISSGSVEQSTESDLLTWETERDWMPGVGQTDSEGLGSEDNSK